MRRICCWTLILLLSTFLAGCERQASESRPLRIGLIAYLQGAEREATGLDSLVAAQMALGEINADGGILLGGQRHLLELAVEEIDTNPEQAMNAARKLINKEQVLAIVGPYFSREAIAAGAVAEQAHVPMIAPVATHPDVTRGRRYVLRGTFLDSRQAEALASFAREELHVGRAALVYDQANAYSSGLAADFTRAFERQQGSVVFSRGRLRGELGDREMWAKLLRSRPDVLFLPVYPPQEGELAELARELGYRGALLGCDAWDSRADARLAALQGAYMTANFSRDVEMPATKQFAEKFTRLRGHAPGDSAALTYDALQMIALGLEQGGKADSDALLKGLYELPPYFGVAGSIDYIDSGDPRKAVVIVELRNGEARFRKFVLQ